MPGLILRDADGRETVLADGDGVTLRIEIGGGLELGTSVKLTVVQGALTVSGDDAFGDPGVRGAIYVDPVDLVFKMSAGPPA